MLIISTCTTRESLSNDHSSSRTVSGHFLSLQKWHFTVYCTSDPTVGSCAMLLCYIYFSIFKLRSTFLNDDILCSSNLLTKADSYDDQTHNSTLPDIFNFCFATACVTSDGRCWFNGCWARSAPCLHHVFVRKNLNNCRLWDRHFERVKLHPTNSKQLTSRTAVLRDDLCAVTGTILHAQSES